MKKSLFFTLLAFAFVSSCQKVENSSGTNPQKQQILYRRGDLTPQVWNGMLTFENEQHLKDYMDHLDSILTTPKDAVFDSTSIYDIDDLLDNIESSMGYTSLRATINHQFEVLNDEGWQSVNNIPEDHWMLGSINRHIYNQNGDVRVGDAIQHLFNKNYTIVISDGNLETLAKAHALQKNISTDGIDSAIFFGVFADDANVRVYNRNVIPTTVLTHSKWPIPLIDTDWTVNYSIDKMTQWDPCNTERTYRVSYVSLHAVNPSVADITLFNNNDKLDIFVSWGDGTTSTYSNQTISKQINGNQTWLFWPSSGWHTYTSPGNYTVTVYAKRPYHTSWVAKTTTTFNIPALLCSWSAKDNGTHWNYSSDGKQAYSSKTQTGQNWIGHVYFQATTKGYKWQNGSFKHKKVERLVAQLWGDLYQNCSNPYTSIAKAAWPYSAKKAEARKGTLVMGQENFTVMYSNHKLLYDNVYYSYDKFLYACQ